MYYPGSDQFSNTQYHSNFYQNTASSANYPINYSSYCNTSGFKSPADNHLLINGSSTSSNATAANASLNNYFNPTLPLAYYTELTQTSLNSSSSSSSSPSNSSVLSACGMNGSVSSPSYNSTASPGLNHTSSNYNMSDVNSTPASTTGVSTATPTAAVASSLHCSSSNLSSCSPYHTSPTSNSLYCSNPTDHSNRQLTYGFY